MQKNIIFRWAKKEGWQKPVCGKKKENLKKTKKPISTVTA